MDTGTLRALLFGCLVGLICHLMALSASQSLVVILIGGAGLFIGAFNYRDRTR
jgi:1,4-dihydroxy-2-naphthoate octaprenyltransferase